MGWNPDAPQPGVCHWGGLHSATSVTAAHLCAVCRAQKVQPAAAGRHYYMLHSIPNSFIFRWE